MTNWALLRDSCGTAEDVPDLLAKAAEGPKEPAWTALWQRLSDSRGTYSASYAALPALAAIARGFPMTSRWAALSLACDIVSHSGRPHDLRELFTAYADEVTELRRLAEETLTDPGVVSGPGYFNALLHLSAFEDVDIRGEKLDHLGAPGCPLDCPNCQALIFVVFSGGSHRFAYYSSLDWDSEAEDAGERYPLLPTSSAAMNRIGQRLHDRALADGRADIATMLTYAYGRARCGGCDSVIDVIANITD